VWLGFLAEPGISQEGLSRLLDTPHVDVTNPLLQEFRTRVREAQERAATRLSADHPNEIRITEFAPEPGFMTAGGQISMSLDTPE
jgi:hypothetical protein